MKKTVFITKAEAKNYPDAVDFVSKQLAANGLKGALLEESIMVFEEFFVRICSREPSDTDIEVCVSRGIAGLALEIVFDGKRFTVDYEASPDTDPGAAILRAYRDKTSINYYRGRNKIEIISQRNNNKLFVLSVAAIIFAVALYLILSIFMDSAQLNELNDRLFYPLEQLFTNAALMISAPVTFLCIVAKITECAVLADRRISMKRIILSVLCGTLMALLAGILTHWILIAPNKSYIGNTVSEFAVKASSKPSLGNVEAIIPSNLVEVFTAVSPFPLIILSILVGVAICSMNRNFAAAKSLNDTLTHLFCRVLDFIMLFIPLGAFLAIMDTLCYSNFKSILVIPLLLLVLFVGELLLLSFYAIRLLINGIKPIEFFKDCYPAMREIQLLDSATSSVPFSTRYLCRNMGMDRELVRQEVPLFARLNMNGNTLFLMIIGLISVTLTSGTPTVSQMLELAALVIAISIGAPDQPGSIMIGTIIVFGLTGLDLQNLSAAIYIEALMSEQLLLLNILGDFVNIGISDKKLKKLKAE